MRVSYHRKHRENGGFFGSEQEFFETIFSVMNAPEESPGTRTPGERNVSVRDSEPASSRTSPVQAYYRRYPETSENREGDLVSQYRSLTESRLCKRCRECASEVVIIPCGHLCVCENCAENIAKCPACGTKVSETIKTFRA